MSTPEGVVTEEYGDFHKIVLQGIMAAGILNLKGVKALFNAACDYQRCTQEERVYKTSMDHVLKIVRGINEQIKPLNMAIKSAACELTGNKFFLFILTVEKSIVKQQLVFSKVEVDMFLACLDGMLRKHPNFSLPFNEAINMLRDIDTRSSVTAAEEFIHRMINLQYFTKYMLNDPEQEEEFDITLGVRGIKEFEPLLVDMYGDVVKNCSLCRMMLLHGFQCPNCKILFHKSCFRRYIAVCKQCKHCKVTWKEEKDMLRRTREVQEDDYIEQEEVEDQGQSQEPNSSVSLPTTSQPDTEPVPGPSGLSSAYSQRKDSEDTLPQNHSDSDSDSGEDQSPTMIIPTRRSTRRTRAGS